jgi:hypothetical protein
MVEPAFVTSQDVWYEITALSNISLKNLIYAFLYFSFAGTPVATKFSVFWRISRCFGIVAYSHSLIIFGEYISFLFFAFCAGVSQMVSAPAISSIHVAVTELLQSVLLSASTCHRQCSRCRLWTASASAAHFYHIPSTVFVLQPLNCFSQCCTLLPPAISSVRYAVS